MSAMRLLLIAVLASCLHTDSVECGFGTCPPGSACDELHGRCVAPGQLVSCNGREDDAACSIAGIGEGICVDQIANTPQNLNAVWGTSASSVWAVGNYGLVMHYDGMTWQQINVPTTRSLSSLHGSASNASGPGVLLHYDGTTWSLVRSLTEIRALWVTPNQVAFFDGAVRFLTRACPTCP